MEFIVSVAAQFVGYLLTELILSTFFFLCGWPVAKLLTLGRYPIRHSRTARGRMSMSAASGW